MKLTTPYEVPVLCSALCAAKAFKLAISAEELPLWAVTPIPVEETLVFIIIPSRNVASCTASKKDLVTTGDMGLGVLRLGTRRLKPTLAEGRHPPIGQGAHCRDNFARRIVRGAANSASKVGC